MMCTAAPGQCGARCLGAPSINELAGLGDGAAIAQSAPVGGMAKVWLSANDFVDASCSRSPFGSVLVMDAQNSQGVGENLDGSVALASVWLQRG